MAERFPAGRKPIAACLLGLLALLGLAGCAGPSMLRSEVTAFHQWEDPPPRTYVFVRDPRLAQSLEHRSYERLLARRLAALGFAEGEPSSARFRVAFEYRAIPEPHRYTEYWYPAGYGPGFPIGPWIGPRMRYGYPYGRLDPLWSMPLLPMTQETTVWRHSLRVDLFDQGDAPPPGKKVWEVTAVAVALSEALPRLMPSLAEAAFSAFPGPSGVTRRVEVPLPEAIR
jgi:hypothetical protein